MDRREVKNIAVLGGGSWGTTLSALLAEKGFSVRLWLREEALCKTILSTRENRVYLPGIKIPESVLPTTSLEEALAEGDLIVNAVPSHGIREVFARAKEHIKSDSMIVSASKGIEEGTLLTPSGIIKDTLGVPPGRVGVLSGPSFAREVAAKLPAAVCAASASDELRLLAQKTFSTPYFRVYTNPDVLGVELGGALKNVIALACGASDGMRLGLNARAALITRGLAEIARLGERMGALPSTFSGLSGLGDLVLTCTGALSRNYTVGVSLGKGERLDEVMKGMVMAVEGVRTAKAAKALSKLHRVEMPITDAVWSVLYEKKSPAKALYELMSRGLRGE